MKAGLTKGADMAVSFAVRGCHTDIVKTLRVMAPSSTGKSTARRRWCWRAGSDCDDTVRYCWTEARTSTLAPTRTG